MGEAKTSRGYQLDQLTAGIGSSLTPNKGSPHKQTFDDIRHQFLKDRTKKANLVTSEFSQTHFLSKGNSQSQYFFSRKNRHQKVDPSEIPNSGNSLLPLDFSAPDRQFYNKKKKWDPCTTGKIEDAYQKVMAKSAIPKKVGRPQTVTDLRAKGKRYKAYCEDAIIPKQALERQKRIVPPALRKSEVKMMKNL